MKNKSKKPAISDTPLKVYDVAKNEGLFRITENQLASVLRKSHETKSYKESFFFSLSIVIGISLVFGTTNFIDALGVPSTSWQAVFIILFGLAFLCICYFGYKWYTNRCSVDETIEKLKENKI